MPRLVALVGLVLLAGCYRTAADPALLARIQKLEARVAQQEQQLAQARAQANSAELAVLAQRLDELATLLRNFEDKAGRAPAAPPVIKRRTPDPRATYAVPVGTSPVLGAAKAKVTLVMVFEFACQYCRRAWDTIDDLRKKYKNDLRVVYKQYIVHPSQAMLPAQAACAAHKQGRFREMADLLWIKAFEAQKFDQATLDGVAADIGLDVARYKADAAGPCVQEVKDEHAMLHKLGVGGTPAFFINGRHKSGARPIEEFSTLIDEELREAAALIKKGVKPELFYDQEIVGKGLTEVPLPP